MQSIFRRSKKVVVLTGLLTVGSVFSASAASAQSSNGNWGAEARIGSAQSASLLRYFSPSWSLVLNGSAGFSNSENENTGVANEGNMQTFTANVLLRKEFGTGRVRPHVAFGPTAFVSRSETKVTSGSGSVSTSNQDVTNLGGRFELGGIVTVSAHVGLGIIGSASATRIRQESRSSTSTTKTTSKGTNLSLNSPQFVIRVRF
ncbi:MAG: hypothetical protein ACO1Q7_02530 [Gemmatimonas sp.]